MTSISVDPATTEGPHTPPDTSRRFLKAFGWVVGTPLLLVLASPLIMCIFGIFNADPLSSVVRDGLLGLGFVLLALQGKDDSPGRLRPSVQQGIGLILIVASMAVQNYDIRAWRHQIARQTLGCLEGNDQSECERADEICRASLSMGSYIPEECRQVAAKLPPRVRKG